MDERDGVARKIRRRPRRKLAHTLVRQRDRRSHADKPGELIRRQEGHGHGLAIPAVAVRRRRRARHERSRRIDEDGPGCRSRTRARGCDATRRDRIEPVDERVEFVHLDDRDPGRVGERRANHGVAGEQLDEQVSGRGDGEPRPRHPRHVVAVGDAGVVGGEQVGDRDLDERRLADGQRVGRLLDPEEEAVGGAALPPGRGHSPDTDGRGVSSGRDSPVDKGRPEQILGRQLDREGLDRQGAVEALEADRDERIAGPPVAGDHPGALLGEVDGVRVRRGLRGQHVDRGLIDVHGEDRVRFRACVPPVTGVEALDVPVRGVDEGRVQRELRGAARVRDTLVDGADDTGERVGEDQVHPLAGERLAR